MPSLNPIHMRNPVDQAAMTLTVCDDNFRVAREIAAYNYIHAQSESDEMYWWEVLEVFEGKAQA